MNITSAAKEMNDIKSEKEHLEDRLKILNARYKELSETVIPKLLDDSEQDKVSFPGIGTIYLQADVHVAMNEGGNTCIAWFKKNGHKDIVKETVHPGTLKSWTKEQLENGGKLPPELRVHQFMKAILRRA